MRTIVLLLLIVPVPALDWSEIMFDTDGRDFGKEWIELTGGERLEGCTVTDSSSSDALELLQEGTEGVILIVESDHVLELPKEPWIYGAGKAIGNGLGNTEEQINISCNQTMLSTEYDSGSIAGWQAGMSIVFDDGWKVGPVSGTPGIVETKQEEPEKEELPDIEDNSEEFCNTTLAITLSSTEGLPGQAVMFTIVSDGYAGFMAESNGTIVLEGDTLSRRSYSLTLPGNDVKLSAYARQCDARQRAVRYIRVMEAPEVPEMPENVNSTENAERPGQNASRGTPRNHTNQTKESAMNSTRNERPDNDSVPAATGRVLYDQDRNVVPWVSAFGIVTLLVSAGLFWKLRKDEI